MGAYEPFVLDNLLRETKALAKITLHDTCVHPLTLRNLSQLAGVESEFGPVSPDRALAYGGNEKLKENILSLYDSPDLALTITQGTISANFLVLHTLLNANDHVICQYPTYQQLYEVPRRLGASVSLWRSKPENGWIPDASELPSLLQKNTKMIILNNPNNPTGAAIPGSVLAEIVTFASRHNIIILCDEIFRFLLHTATTEAPPTVLSFASKYKNIIVTSSVSKAFALPGVRLGWVVSANPDLIHQIVLAKDYTTLSISQIDQEIAAFALANPVRDRILQRSLNICAKNLSSLEKFVSAHDTLLQWVKPTAAASAFVRMLDAKGNPVDDQAYSETLLRETGLLLVPGGMTFGTESREDFQGYLRIGFVCGPEQFEEALQIWGDYMRHCQEA